MVSEKRKISFFKNRVFIIALKKKSAIALWRAYLKPINS